MSAYGFALVIQFSLYGLWCLLAVKLFELKLAKITLIIFSIGITTLSQLIVYDGLWLSRIINYLSQLLAHLHLPLTKSLFNHLVYFILFIISLTSIGWAIILATMVKLSPTKKIRLFLLLIWLVGGSCISLFTLGLTMDIRSGLVSI